LGERNPGLPLHWPHCVPPEYVLAGTEVPPVVQRPVIAAPFCPAALFVADKLTLLAGNRTKRACDRVGEPLTPISRT
jgi:hypothetical protein